MRLSSNTRNAYIAMAALMLAGGLIRASVEFGIISIPVSTITFACYTGFVLVWMRLMNSRFLHPMVIPCIRVAGALMVSWLLLRTIRYDFLVGMVENKQLSWYAYYMFYAFIPAFLLLAVLHAGKRPDERIGRAWWLLLAAAGAISLLFLTNDLHEWAFRIDRSPELEGIPLDDHPYTYGPLYFASWIWTVGLAVAAVVFSAVKTARAKPRWQLLVLLLPILLGVSYSLAYSYAHDSIIISAFKLPEVVCFLVVLFMEILVRLGFFAANEGYAELWRASSLNGGLMDEGGRVAFASAGVPDVTQAQVLAALDAPVALDANTELAARAIQGGTAFWLRDLTHVHELQAQLEGLGNVLEEENAMLRAENDLAREHEALAQREILHEQIMAAIAPQLSAIEGLLSDIPADEDAFLERMHRAAIHAAYAKRYANLMLSGEAGAVDGRELALAMAETAEWARRYGIDATVPACPSTTMATEDALLAYRTFADAVLHDLTGGDAP